MKYLKASVSFPGCREDRAAVSEGGGGGGTHYNLTAAAHVRQSLMLLTLNFLCGPLSHLTLIANYPDLLDNVNNAAKKKTKTKTYAPDRPGACHRSRPSGRKREKKAVSVSAPFRSNIYHTSLPQHTHTHHISHSNTHNSLGTLHARLTTAISAPRAARFEPPGPRQSRSDWVDCVVQMHKYSKGTVTRPDPELICHRVDAELVESYQPVPIHRGCRNAE